MADITVIIPVYNVQDYLEKCVDSVLAQSYSDYEILLIDDGSTDNSGALCDEIAAKHAAVRVIHQSNKGLGGARNTGMDNCDTEYVLFLDSDDSIHPDLLKTCMAPAKELDCDVVFFDSIAVYPDGTTGSLYSCAVPSNTLLEKEACKPLVQYSSACNRIFKLSLFKAHGIYFPEKLWYEDLHTTPKATAHVNRAYYCNAQPMYYYLQRHGSIMHTPDFERIVQGRLVAVEAVENYYAAEGLSEQYATELAYIRLYHGYFLPVREMLSGKFEKHADVLRQALLEKNPNPLDNPYIAELSQKERQMLKWFFNRNYKTVRLLSQVNKVIKKVKHVK